MLWMIVLILLALWTAGFMSSYTMGGFVHILLVAAVGVMLLGIFRRQRTA